MELNALTPVASNIQVKKQAPEVVERQRRENEDAPANSALEGKRVMPEEVLTRINGLTENGLYSVRFEKDERADTLVVRIVDNETGEVKRQIPPEELLGLTKRLEELRGNVIDAVS